MEKERSKAIIRSGYYFILTNFLLAALNIFIGVFSNSIAILSDASHSLIDAISGFIIIISEKLAKKKGNKDKRQKIERIATIIIAILIILTGIHIIIESIEKINNPGLVHYSGPVLTALLVGLLLKCSLALYLKIAGKKHKSSVLLASCTETANDALISLAVLLSVLIYVMSGVNIEAYISMIISLIIIKIGLEFIFPKITSKHHHPLDTDPTHGA